VLMRARPRRAATDADADAAMAAALDRATRAATPPAEREYKAVGHEVGAWVGSPPPSPPGIEQKRTKKSGGRLNIISSFVDSIADGLEEDAAEDNEQQEMRRHHESLDVWSGEALEGSIASVRNKLHVRSAAETAEEQEARKLRELQMVATTLRAVLAKRQEELGWRSPCAYNTRMLLAWLFNVGVLLVGCFFSVIYALKFQEEATRNMCMAWLVAYGVTFAFVEPFQVLVIACFPGLSNEDTACGRFCGRCRFMYNELCAP